MERGKGCPVGPLRRPQNGDWCPGKCSAKSSAWKGLGSNVKVTFAGDNQCLLWDVGRQWSRVRRLQRAAGMCAWGRLVSRQRQGDSWAGTAPVWLCWPRPGVQISRYLFAETPEGGKEHPAQISERMQRVLRGAAPIPAGYFLFQPDQRGFFSPSQWAEPASTMKMHLTWTAALAQSVCLSFQAARHQPQTKQRTGNSRAG